MGSGGIVAPAPASEARWCPLLAIIPSSNRPASLPGSTDELLDITGGKAYRKQSVRPSARTCCGRNGAGR